MLNFNQFFDSLFLLFVLVSLPISSFPLHLSFPKKEKQVSSNLQCFSRSKAGLYGILAKNLPFDHMREENWTIGTIFQKFVFEFYWIANSIHWVYQPFWLSFSLLNDTQEKMYFIVRDKVWLILCLMINQMAGKYITTIKYFLWRWILADIDLSPNASWDQFGVTVAGWSNGTNVLSLTQLSHSFGISITDTDDLYISDTNNHRIVVVDLTFLANITVIGSGPGTAINGFNQLYDLFIKNTSLYVTDTQNRRVQMMSLDGLNQSTVAVLSRHVPKPRSLGFASIGFERYWFWSGIQVL